MASDTLGTFMHGCVALALIAASTVLLALGKIDGTTALALYTAALATINAGTSTALALRVPAKPTPPPEV